MWRRVRAGRLHVYVSVWRGALQALSNVHATYLIIFMQSARENEGFISRMRSLLINFTKSEMFCTLFINCFSFFILCDLFEKLN